jgi:hypothetical protein
LAAVEDGLNVIAAIAAVTLRCEKIPNFNAAVLAALASLNSTSVKN